MSDPQERKQSPLRAAHLEAGGKLVPFAGWEMPLQYAGIMQEHAAVRSAVGVFDISHMGEFLVSGPDAARNLERLLTNRIAALKPGGGQYSLLCNTQGGVIDDLIVYRIAEEQFFLVVNASMVAEDRRWIEAHLTGDVQFQDCSDQYAGLAVQGPDAESVFRDVMGGTLPPRNGVLYDAEKGTVICRTGYTGEDGFEHFCPVAEAEALWRRYGEAGVTPCGLGARDSLRLEMGYPLNGQDLSPERTPLEAGLGFFVDLEKDFLGCEAMRQQKSAGLTSRLAAFRLTKKGPPPRPHYPVCIDEVVCGEVASGGQSPSLGVGIGMAYLPLESTAPGTEIAIDVRGRLISAEVVKNPIYRKAT